MNLSPCVLYLADAIAPVTRYVPQLIDENSDGSISALVSASYLAPDLSARVTPWMHFVPDPQLTSGDEDMAESDDSASETSENAPLVVLARYAENRRVVLA